MLNGKNYALKIIPKYNLYTKGTIYSLLNEPNILKRLNKSNFIPEIISSFQDYDNFYIVTTFYKGPTLIKLSYKKLSEEQIKFISACIILSLKDLRQNRIIHRDLTFHNIIMDEDNYFNLIDFSFSINYSLRNSEEFICNTFRIITPPEILNKSDYDYNSDYYRLGNLIFFLVFKKFPQDIKKSRNWTELLKDYKLTEHYSNNFLNFINSLIDTDMKKRIGYNNISELINHPWFSNLDWEKLEKKQITSPFNIKEHKINSYACKNFNKTKNRIQSYLKLSRTRYYGKLLKNFEFSRYIVN